MKMNDSQPPENARTAEFRLKGEAMLIHPLAERLRAPGLAAMADTFLQMQLDPAAAELSREDWLGLLLEREVTARDNKRLSRRQPGAPAPERAGRGHRFPRATRPGSRLVPPTRRLRLDPPQPAFGDQRSNRGWQVLAGLRAGTQGLPGRFLRAVSPGATAVCRTRRRAWRGQAATDAGDAGTHRLPIIDD